MVQAMASHYVNVRVNPPSELEYSFTLEAQDTDDPILLAKAALFDRSVDPIGTVVDVYIRKVSPASSPWFLVFHHD